MIRPAKCYFNGFMKPFIKGADKNHNPRKGTETSLYPCNRQHSFSDKNHNPRKGTETALPGRRTLVCNRRDKNHNPRKGTET